MMHGLKSHFQSDPEHAVKRFSELPPSSLKVSRMVYPAALGERRVNRNWIIWSLY